MMIVDPPSPFVARWLRPIRDQLGAAALEPPRALDLAMGRGRHTLALAESGFRAYGVDMKLDAIASAVGAARGRSLAIHAWCADLTIYPLPRERFELVVVCRYLQRDLFPSIAATVVPGGFVVYETFTTHQRALGSGPRSPDHLLEDGELRARFAEFSVLFYEEVRESEAVARIVAQRTRRS